MGCLVFIVALIFCGFFYMTVGGLVVDWIMDLKGIEGLDAHGVVMAYAFQWAPLLSLMTALIPTVLILRKQYADQAEALKQKGEEENSAE